MLLFNESLIQYRLIEHKTDLASNQQQTSFRAQVEWKIQNAVLL